MKALWGVALSAAILLGGCSKTTPGGEGQALAYPSQAGALRSAQSSPTTQWRYAGLPDRGSVVAYARGAEAIREGAYRWTPVELSEAHALAAVGPGRAMGFTSKEGRQLAFQYQRHVEHADGSWTWVGTLHGQPGEEAIITFGSKAAFGSIAQGRGELPLRLTTRAGRPWLVDSDPAELAKLGKWFLDPDKTDAPLPPARPPLRKNKAPPASMAAAQAAGGGVIDVLVGYTNGFALGLGGDSQALTRINFLIEVGNQAHQNSQDGVQLRLVHAMAVNYADATDNAKALDALTGVDSENKKIVPPDPAFAALRAARDTHGADLVTLLRKFSTPENDSCGVAWLIGGGLSPIVPQEDEYYGYSVISDGTDRDEGDGKTYFCRNETLVHELGHNMGSAHDTGTSENKGAYPYSHGYKTDAAGGNFYTVMAYGDSGQTSYRTFSSPAITFCGGFACGVVDSVDNARSLWQTSPLIAQFRAGNGGPVVRTNGDVDADGKADLTWYNGATGSVYHWLMNGAVITGGFSSGSAGPGTNDHSTGDFNRDGRADLLYSTSTEVRILLGTGGAGQLAVVGPRLSSNWRVAALGDFDGDGYGDVFWHDLRTGNLCYWLMNGSSLRETRCGFWINPGQTVRAVGDFNADARVDILFSDNSRLYMRLGGVDTGIGSTLVADHPQGWTIAGAGDVDGDRKADIVWHNGATGQVYTWFMNGQTVLGGSLGPTMALGATPRAVADFNGDRRADVVFADNSEVRMLLASGSGFSNTLIGAPPAGWGVVIDRPTKRPALIRADLNANGLSDVVLYSQGAGKISHWMMNGVVRTATGPELSLPSGYTPRALADFTGDSRVDLLLSNGLSLRMWIGNGDGSFADVAVGAHSSGWNIVGAGDLNVDGKSDVVWHNPTTGEVYYWLMNGASIFDGRGGFFPGAGQTLRSVADMDGDGRADLVFSNGSQVRLLQATSAGGFNNLLVGNHTAGWELSEAGDADDDGKADLFWHQPASGALYLWLMDGALVRSGRSGGTFAAGFAPRSIPDFDGDGRGDVIADNGSIARIYLGPNLAGQAGNDVGTLGAGWRILRAN